MLKLVWVLIDKDLFYFYPHICCTNLTSIYDKVSLVQCDRLFTIGSSLSSLAVSSVLKPSWPPIVEQTCTNCTVLLQYNSTAQYYSKILQHNTTVQYYSTTITQIALIVPTVLLLNSTSTNVILILTLEYPILILALNYKEWLLGQV